MDAREEAPLWYLIVVLNLVFMTFSSSVCDCDVLILELGAVVIK